MDQPPVAATPQDLDRLLERFLFEGDATAASLLYEEDAVFVNAGKVLWKGRAAIAEGLAVIAAGRPRIVGAPRIVAESDGVAIMYNDWTEHGVESAGRPFTREGKALEVVRRGSDGTWRFVLDDPYGRG